MSHRFEHGQKVGNPKDSDGINIKSSGHKSQKLFAGVFLMSVLWVICGAGRGVGKTTLALNLCQCLPNSCYAKCGHGTKKPQRPEPFFENQLELDEFLESSQRSYSHLVVESNAIARMGRGDMVVFIDGIKGKTDFRNDAQLLREKAHICLCQDTKITDWKKQLSERICSKSLIKNIYDALVSQKQFLFGSAPTVRSKVWFESAGEHVFGMGLACLLEKVDRLGTLQAAAKALNMSYRYAWDLIREAEKHLGQSLIERHAGGADGGGSVLSDHGRQMLTAFIEINDDVSAYADTCFKKLYDRENSNAGQ